MDNYLEFCQIKGLGEKRIETLKKAGIMTPLDLLMHFPYVYFDRSSQIDWSGFNDGDPVVFEGRVAAKPSLSRIRKGLSVTRTKVESGGKLINCSWFNQDFLWRTLTENSIKLFIGRIKKYKNSFEISSPQIYEPRSEKITPIYKLPKGIPQNVMTEVCREVLGIVRLESYVGDIIAEYFGLMDLKRALLQIHFPTETAAANVAKHNIALQQLAYTVSVYALAKNAQNNRRVFEYQQCKKELRIAIDSLPFELTADQRDAHEKLLTEMKSDNRMNVLLQGDVGSGKTVVVFLSMLVATLSGYQAAIMAPTDILARQHYINAIGFFEPLGIKVGFLSGGQSKQERETTAFNIKNSVVKVVVGTHAIISKDIEFDNLALTVVDEQHRFGVCQRGSLENKTEAADNIVMSATPIPRTLALSLYGELKQISIFSKPNARNNIKTAIVPTAKLGDMYSYITQKSAVGEKTFIVCPRVDSDDGISVLGLYKQLHSGALKGVKLGILYGQMRENEKSAVMHAFADGDLNVLICTTVIEVGIDIKGATTMVVFGADRFGLSQLHQLRGRVGRDGRESYCFVNSENDSANERLKYLCECDDGFKLAEYDFNIRGAGDFLGTRQHGDESDFGGIKIDGEMIKEAKLISEAILSNAGLTAALKENAADKKEFIKALTLN